MQNRKESIGKMRESIEKSGESIKKIGKGPRIDAEMPGSIGKSGESM
ncbi:hypothetical protein [Salibacterium qingdaonense]|nr:hypothetical protein [Salibacterium qingdaonense]